MIVCAKHINQIMVQTIVDPFDDDVLKTAIQDCNNRYFEHFTNGDYWSRCSSLASLIISLIVMYSIDVSDIFARNAIMIGIICILMVLLTTLIKHHDPNTNFKV